MTSPRVPPELHPYQDASLQITTALIHGDRDLAFEIAEEAVNPKLLAVIIADLAVHIHVKWCASAGITSDEVVLGVWRQLVNDVAEWREGSAP